MSVCPLLIVLSHRQTVTLTAVSVHQSILGVWSGMKPTRETEFILITSMTLLLHIITGKAAGIFHYVLFFSCSFSKL